MMVDSTDLAGITEIADALGVHKATVVNWTTRHPDSFPRPVIRLRCGPIYELSRVIAWHQRYETGVRVGG